MMTLWGHVPFSSVLPRTWWRLFPSWTWFFPTFAFPAEGRIRKYRAAMLSDVSLLHSDVLQICHDA